MDVSDRGDFLTKLIYCLNRLLVVTVQIALLMVAGLSILMLAAWALFYFDHRLEVMRMLSCLP